MYQETQYISLQHTHNSGLLFFRYVNGLVVVVRQDTSNFVLCDIVDIIIIMGQKHFRCNGCLVYQICTIFLNVFIYINFLQGQDIFQRFANIGILPHYLQYLPAVHNKTLATKVPVHVNILFAQLL